MMGVVDDEERALEMNGYLMDRLPELRAAYEREVDGDGEEPGPYVIYGTVFVQHLERLLASPRDPGVRGQLERAFELLEDLVGHPDPEYRNLALVAVCEHLEAYYDLAIAARPFLGPDVARVIEAAQPRPEWKRPRRHR